MLYGNKMENQINYIINWISAYCCYVIKSPVKFSCVSDT